MNEKTLIHVSWLYAIAISGLILGVYSTFTIRDTNIDRIADVGFLQRQINVNESRLIETEDQQYEILRDIYRTQHLQAIEIAAKQQDYDTYTQLVSIGGWAMNEVRLSNGKDEIIVNVNTETIIVNR